MMGALLSLLSGDDGHAAGPGVTYLFPDADPNFPTGQPGLALNRKIAEEGGLR